MRPRTHAGSRRGMPVRALLRLAFALALSGAAVGANCNHGVNDNPDKNHCVNCAAKGKCSGTRGGSYCTDVCPPNYHLKQSEHSPSVHHAGIYCSKPGHWELNSDKSRAVCAADDCGPHTDKDGDSDLQGPAQMIHLLPENAHWKNGTDWGCFAGQTGTPNPKGARCEAECDEGYYGSKGSGVFTCDPDQAPNGVKRNDLRQWAYDLQCTKDNTCPAEPPDAHASIKAGCDSRCSSDQACTMTCDQGYRTADFKTEQLLMCSCREGQPHWAVYGTETLQLCLGCQNPRGFPVQCTCDGPPVQGADSYRAYSSDRQNEYVQQDVRCNTTAGFQKLDPDASPSSYRCDVGDSSSNGTWVLVNGTAELVCVLRASAPDTPPPAPSDTGPVIRPEEDWPWIVLGAVLLMLCSALAVLAVYACTQRSKPLAPSTIDGSLRHSQLRDSILSDHLADTGMSGQSTCAWVLYFVVSVVVIGLTAIAVRETDYYTQGGGSKLEAACAASGIAACLLTLPMSVVTMGQMRRLRTAPDPLAHLVHEQRQAEMFSGWFGVVMFAVGILDICQDLWLAHEVRHDDLLLFTVLSSSAATAVTSVILGFRILNEIEATVEDASQWMVVPSNMRKAKWIVLFSASRIESLSILRLRLCGRTLIKFPMEAKHFFFIQTTGMYHLFMEEIPHLLVVFSQHSGGTSGEEQGEWSYVDMLTVGLGAVAGLALVVQGVLAVQAWANVRSSVRFGGSE